MKCIDIDINGGRLLAPDFIFDKRGYFARTFCNQHNELNDIQFLVKQINISYNEEIGTLRGMHYQANPMPDPKIVTCISGKVFDVVVDIRSTSPTFGRWSGFS